MAITSRIVSPQEERLSSGDPGLRSDTRVSRILREIRSAPPRVAVERGLLFTESFKQTESLPLVVRWAKAIEHVVKNISLYIGPDDLIVGRAGPPGRYGILYPELQGVYFDQLAETLLTREKASFRVTEEDARIMKEEIWPYWRGKTFLEAYANALPEDTKNLVFKDGDMFSSAFMIHPTATSRHSLQWALDYSKVLNRGFSSIKRDAQERLARLDPWDPENHFGKYHFYQAVIIVCDAMVTFAKRYADLARRMAATETDERRKAELERIADVCDWVPGNPARSFHEAIQSHWFTQLVSRIEQLSDGGIGNGRMDQFLYPFYKRDREEGHLTEAQALELLECLWLNIAQIIRVPETPSDYAAQEGYPHFEQVMLGGQTPDGKDATNELSYLILRSKKELPMNYPDLSVRIHSGTPQPFLLKVCELIKEGTGFPKLFNDEEIIPLYLAHGATLEEARDWVGTGCTETRLINRETYLTGGGWLDLAAAIEMALHDGRMRSLGDQRAGISTGDPTGFATFDDMWRAFKLQVEHLVRHTFIQQYVADTVRPQKLAAPHMSCLHDLCMEQGIDIDQGKLDRCIALGQLNIIGFGTTIDSLAAIKKLVYDDKAVSMAQLVEALDANFEGHEALRQRCLNAPKYGNNDPYVDSIGRDIEELLTSLAGSHRNAYGGHPNVIYLPVTTHVGEGRAVGATPNGRKAGTPLSEGISPTQGCDVKGPTVTLLSINATKCPSRKARAARLLNLKLSPQAVAGDEGTRNLASFIRAWCDMKFWHVQFSVINSDTLREAQKRPEDYRNLLVRVAGYSAYFVELSKDLQNEIIARTEHQFI